MAAALNLNNEVVKMRAEVKKVKVFVIRKLTRQITALKKKKGTAESLERNQRRAARLYTEIKELKALPPDSITKAALQKDISFEKVCQNKEASLSERAIARIATFPDFSRRIQDIKKAIETFKAERKSAAKAEKQKQKESKDIVLNQKSEQDSDAEEGSEDEDGENNKEDEEDDGPSQMIQKVDTQELNEMVKQDEETPKEKSSETHSTQVEVVRMRKEVKKLRMLIIRKLTQQITNLKKKKGEESEVKANQESATSLQKEVQILRSLLPDCVTTRALQENINMEEVFQDPKSSPLERATARIATHPRFIKKLQDVRLAIEEEKTKAAKAEEKKKKDGENLSKVTIAEDTDEEQEDSEDEEEEEEDEDDEGESESEESGAASDESDDGEVDEPKSKEKNQPLNVNISKVLKPSESTKSAAITLSSKEKAVPSLISKEGETKQVVKPPVNLKSISKPPVPSKESPVSSEETPVPSKETPVPSKETPVPSKETPVPSKETPVPSKETPVPNKETPVPSKETPVPSKVTPVSRKETPVSSKVTPVKKAPPARKEKAETKKPENKKEEEESDLESDEEEEKEYFDDSTEERFHKLSSLSEESDDDDFFLGKVSKLKKKKSSASGAVKKIQPKKPTEELNAEEDSHTSKYLKMQSVFCSTLSKSSGGPQKGKHQGPKSARFQNQKNWSDGDAKPSWFKSQGPGPDRRSSAPWPKAPGQRQMGGSGGRMGKPAERQHSHSNKGGPGKPFRPPQHSQQVLHPSWEASRKRKEQQSQITAFQGKKIKFDDDD